MESLLEIFNLYILRAIFKLSRELTKVLQRDDVSPKDDNQPPDLRLKTFVCLLCVAVQPHGLDGLLKWRKTMRNCLDWQAVAKRTSLFRFFISCSGESGTQVKLTMNTTGTANMRYDTSANVSR